MSDVTPEFIAEARRTAEYEAERFPNDDWPPIVLALLDALDAADTRVAAAEREALERAAQAIEEVGPIEWALYGQEAGQEAARIVRDLMPRKDGE